MVGLVEVGVAGEVRRREVDVWRSNEARYSSTGKPAMTFLLAGSALTHF